MQLFDLIRVMFTNPTKYQNLKNSDKAKNMFMINRFFAIKYPTTAQSLNKNGINPWAVVDLWQLVSKRNNRVPGWIWTKTKKAEKQKKQWTPDKNIAKFWMNANKLTQKDLDAAIKYNPKELKKTLDNLKKRISVDGK